VLALRRRPKKKLLGLPLPPEVVLEAMKEPQQLISYEADLEVRQLEVPMVRRGN